MMSKKIIIIGQGIAGTCLAWEAERLGVDFRIIDQGSSTSASAVSSGIMNPITGRNFVKSWKSDDFITAGRKMYEDMGHRYGTKLISHIPMIRHLPSIESENIWHSKASQEGYKEHMKSGPDNKDIDKILNNINALGTVVSTQWVDVPRLLRLNRDRWIAEGKLIDAQFAEEGLGIRENTVVYEDDSYDAMILAMGWEGGKNKIFETDVYRPAKGEVLIVRIPNMPSEYIIKYNKFIVPLGDSKYWIGTTWQWEFDHADSEESKSLELEEFLNEFLKLEFEILDRKAGVRPATKYRRPLIGSHPDHNHIFLLNGLGTKGVTMAPYWASLIIEHVDSPQLGSELHLTDAFQKSFNIK